MKFGPIRAEEAEGAILAHATIAGTRKVKKGTRLGADDIEALRAAGIGEVIAARLASSDVGEDDAATRIARALRFTGASAKAAATGRVNIHADAAGVFVVSRALVDGINRIDPAVTIATLAEHARVERGQMVATIKIIPFAVDETILGRAEALAGSGEVFAVHLFRARRVAVIQTVLPALKSSVMDKTARITAQRLDRSSSAIVVEERPGHEAAATAAAIERVLPQSDMVLVFGASALCDFDDVIPEAIRHAGGTVARVGMPVDPGNLLVLGEIGGKPVIGAPGCARSPKDNGFDWVIDRLMAGLEVTHDDIAGMGVGGLLMEIPSRPQPREAPRRVESSGLHAIVLAAGRSSRMGGPNKLLAGFDGVPLVRRTVDTVVGAVPGSVTVVTGHQAERIEEALAGLDVRIVHNPDHADGLSSSLKAGISSLPVDVAGALIVLADMPRGSAGDIR